MFALAALGCAAPLSSQAVADAAAQNDVASLKSELEALKADYAARVATLEQRITQLESSAAAAEAAAVAAPEATVAAPSGSGPTSAGAFNPGIAVILSGNYANLSQDPESYRIAGFIPAGDEVGPGERSFNLGESEINLAANVDPYFYGSLTAALTAEGEVEVEEAFFRTIALPAGLLVKGGRFFSGFGYLNELHAHTWDFVDQPLVYQAFFGGQRAQDGLQVKWVAPTDFFLELGAESGNGEGFPGTRRDANGLNGTTLFAHVGTDIGDAWTWRGGISWVDARAEERAYEDVDALGEAVENAFSGKSQTWIADLTFKWLAQGDPRRRSLKLQGEYMHRKEDGELTFDAANRALIDAYETSQSGWYVQGVYQFLPRWRVGARYDWLDSGSPHIGLVESGLLSAEDFPLLAGADPTRTTLMLDWSLTEFSRLRAQLAWDDARDAATDEQFFLQYIYALGAHGAHKF